MAKTAPVKCECGSDMWDNRDTKRNPKQPDYKCKDKTCGKATWLSKEEKAAQKPVAQTSQSKSAPVTREKSDKVSQGFYGAWAKDMTLLYHHEEQRPKTKEEIMDTFRYFLQNVGKELNGTVITPQEVKQNSTNKTEQAPEPEPDGNDGILPDFDIDISELTSI